MSKANPSARNRIVSVCVSEEFLVAIHRQCGRTGRSRSDVVFGLFDQDAVAQLLTAREESALTIHGRQSPAA